MNNLEPAGHRRSIRLPGFNYSQAGVYFVTICAFERRCLFGRMRDDAVDLGAIGRIVQARWLEMPQRFAHAELDAYVVMPNHLHGILLLHRTPARDPGHAEGFQKPVAGSLPTIIRSFKAEVSARAKHAGVQPGHPVWQRNYFERVLRDGKEYSAAARYILENPARWHFDHENPERS
jgi:putative transposase